MVTKVLTDMRITRGKICAKVLFESQHIILFIRRDSCVEAGGGSGRASPGAAGSCCLITPRDVVFGDCKKNNLH